MDAEERRLLAEEGHPAPARHGNQAVDSQYRGEKGAETDGTNGQTHDLGPAPHKKPNMITKWLKPNVYCDYATMRRLVPKDVEIRYDQASKFSQLCAAVLYAGTNSNCSRGRSLLPSIRQGPDATSLGTARPSGYQQARVRRDEPRHPDHG